MLERAQIFIEYTHKPVISLHDDRVPLGIGTRLSGKQKRLVKTFYLWLISLPVKCAGTTEFHLCTWFMLLHFSSFLILARRAKVETCRLPFIFPEECWLLVKMLSVITQDKLFQFINKIDGTAYRQFLFFVFTDKFSCQKHPCYLANHNFLSP